MALPRISKTTTSAAPETLLDAAQAAYDKLRGERDALTAELDGLKAEYSRRGSSDYERTRAALYFAKGEPYRTLSDRQLNHRLAAAQRAADDWNDLNGDALSAAHEALERERADSRHRQALAMKDAYAAKVRTIAAALQAISDAETEMGGMFQDFVAATGHLPPPHIIPDASVGLGVLAEYTSPVSDWFRRMRAAGFL